MKTITQNASPNFSSKSSKSYEKEPKDDFFDDYTVITTPPPELMGFETIEPINTNSKVSTMFSSSSAKSSETSRNNTKITPGGTKYTTYDDDVAQKKFGTAKAISSDQFFNNETSSFERSANLSKFQGSNSISSAEYFGDGPSGGRNESRGIRGSVQIF